MAVDRNLLLARQFAPSEHVYSHRDVMLYALGVGLGQDPADENQLPFVYEGHRGPMVLPTFAMVLAYPGFWAKAPDTGIDWRRLVHAEQSFVLHAPLPAAGRVIGHSRVTSILDKGPEKGAFLTQERDIVDGETGRKLASIAQVSMLRGDGGCGSSEGAVAAVPHRLPERSPDCICDLPTSAQAALIYRLSGDANPLHADPVVARAAGFSRPILHGLCTMGVACHAVLRSLLEYDPSRVRGMRVRFTAPVLPGDTLRTELWRDGEVVSFRTTAVERQVAVLGAGRIDIAPAMAMTSALHG